MGVSSTSITLLSLVFSLVGQPSVAHFVLCRIVQILSSRHIFTGIESCLT
ncbi:unnamed protein product [Amoebophrya sp. A25]|nr:unnamed protein product [Amoebophrya sp. A25]|eukprot:GSA25T00008735001.1